MSKTPGSPRLRYWQQGESGSPVLLIMGFGMRGRAWEPQIDPLSKSHRVAWFDHRGIGESDPVSGSFSMRTLAADCVRLLDTMGWDTAHVTGVSMGGMVAQELALQAPRRLRSLTLVATHSGGLRSALPHRQGLAEFARANLGPKEERARTLMRLLYPEEFLASVDQKSLEHRTEITVGDRAPRRTVLGQFRAVLGHRTRKRLRHIEAPTLIVRPARDILIRPTNSDRLKRGIRNSTVLKLDDAGHGCLFQSAETINRALLAHYAHADAKHS